MMHAELTKPVLDLRDVRKAYGSVVALSGIDFNVAAGETHVLLGENGAGKSTLIKLISGAIEKDGGTMLLSGHHLDGLSPQQRREEGLSVIYQELSLIAGLTVSANIFLGRRMQKPGALGWLGFGDHKAMEAMCHRLFAELEIDLDPRRLVRDMSIAERQLIEIGRAVAFNSKLILMDEPTTALGPKEKDALFRIMSTLTSRGIGIVFISHILEDCLALGDRITVLRDGKLIRVFRRGEADEDSLIAAMTGRSQSERFPRIASNPGTQNAIEVVGLNVPGRVSDINFSLRQGEILGFAGLVGAGRSEIMEALYGAGPKPSSGTIRIFGKTYKRLTPRRALAAGISFLTEDRKTLGILPMLPIADNMGISALNLKGATLTQKVMRLGLFVRRSRLVEYARSMISEHGIRASSPNQLISHLSGGNQQKVLLVRALAAESRIIILDEPTKGIDAGAKQEIYLALQTLVGSGASVIIVSSEIPEVLALSDRIIVMAKGRITGILNSSEASPEIILNLAFDRQA